MWMSAWVYLYAGLSEPACLLILPLVLGFHFMWCCSIRTRSPLSRGTPAAGRNKHNEFFSIVAVLWAPPPPHRILNYRDVERQSVTCRASTRGKAHQEALPGINQLGTEDEEGLDSDVINPLALQEVCQRWESLQSFQRMEWIWLKRLEVEILRCKNWEWYLIIAGLLK